MIFDWVASNLRHFNGAENVDQWGKIVKNGEQVQEIQIIKSVLDKYFFIDVQSKPILTEWRKNDYILVDSKETSFTKILRFGDITARCVCLLPKKDNENMTELIPINDDTLPF